MSGLACTEMWGRWRQ